MSSIEKSPEVLRNLIVSGAVLVGGAAGFAVAHGLVPSQEELQAMASDIDQAKSNLQSYPEFGNCEYEIVYNYAKSTSADIPGDGEQILKRFDAFCGHNDSHANLAEVTSRKLADIKNKKFVYESYERRHDSPGLVYTIDVGIGLFTGLFIGGSVWLSINDARKKFKTS